MRLVLLSLWLLAAAPAAAATQAAGQASRRLSPVVALRERLLETRTVDYLTTDDRGRLWAPSPADAAALAGTLREIEAGLRAAGRDETAEARDRLEAEGLANLARLRRRSIEERGDHLLLLGAAAAGDRTVRAAREPRGIGAYSPDERLAAYLEDLPGYAARLEENLLAAKARGRFPARAALREEIEQCRRLARGLMRSLSAAPISDLGLMARLPREAGAAQAAFERHADFLEQELLPFAPERQLLGEAEYEWRLRNVLLVDASPAELRERALDAARRARARMEELAAALYPGADLAEAMRRLREETPADDEALMAAYASALERMAAFSAESGLFDPPPGAPELRPTPADVRSRVPVAAYSVVGRKVLVTTAREGGSLDAHPLALIPVVAAHEGFPGHALHHERAGREESGVTLLRFAHGDFSPAMASEGHAFRVEKLLRDRGALTPKEELAGLGMELLRAWRMALDPAVHLGLLTPEQAARTLGEEAFLPEALARAEVSRFLNYPMEAVTYLAGREQIDRLEARARAALGAAFREKEFHRAFFDLGFVAPALMGAALVALLKARAAGSV